jgi:hypothetical protein
MSWSRNSVSFAPAQDLDAEKWSADGTPCRSFLTGAVTNSLILGSLAGSPRALCPNTPRNAKCDGTVLAFQHPLARTIRWQR